MFKIVENKIYSDGTRDYTIELDKDYTVSEFINTVLQRHTEKGSIKIKIDDTPEYDYPLVEYFEDELTYLDRDIPLNAQVLGAKAWGGYSQINYILEIFEE